MTDDAWTLVYEGLRPEEEGLRESLCALGNGRFVTRGAAEESRAGERHYPGTYVAGGYNRLSSEVAGRTVVNEDLVNFPNWLPLTFRPEDGDWFSLDAAEVLSCRQELSLRDGVLTRRLRVRDGAGRVTAVESRRLVHMRTPWLAAIQYCVTPENWSGGIRVRSELDGTVTNAGVARYRQLSSRHLEVVESGPVAPEGVYLLARTTQSRFEVGEAARTRLFLGETPVEGERIILREEPGRVGEELRAEVAEGETLRVEKVVGLYASRHPGVTEAGLEARLAVGRAPGFAAMLETHRLAWQALWRRFDVEMACETEACTRQQLILRLHVFHLLQTVSHNTVGLDVGVPARGLHGEAYRGHVFWDDLFIFPFYNLRTPSVTRSLLLYRYHRLEAARELAREAGCAGAMFPWQSSSDGREATQEVHLNPLSGRWDPDHSRLQRHVNAAIAFNVWQYFRVTGDRTFLVDFGAELILEIARFWSSLATWSEEDGRFEIGGVMGPDEYHEKYPGAEAGGLRNNAYTNVTAVWCLLRALDALEVVGPSRRAELLALLGLGEAELERWEEITRKMKVPFHGDGIVSQFEGYGALEELDWEKYREKYGNVERLDRILKAEGDSPDRYRVAKQADVNMLFHLLDPEEVKELFARLGYPLGEAALDRNISYYLQRTSHGSTLSRMVFASVVHQLDPEAGWRLFLDALRSDVEDVQGGTTAEGVHLGAMAGTVAMVLTRYAGVRMGDAGVTLDPALPGRLARLRFRLHYRGRWLDVELTHSAARVTADRDGTAPVPVEVGHTWHAAMPGETLEVPLSGAPAEG